MKSKLMPGVGVRDFDASVVLNQDHLCAMHNHLNYWVFGNVLQLPIFDVVDFVVGVPAMGAFGWDDSGNEHITLMTWHCVEQWFYFRVFREECHFQTFVYGVLMHEMMHQNFTTFHQDNTCHLLPEWKAECNRIADFLGLTRPQSNKDFNSFPHMQKRTKGEYGTLYNFRSQTVQS